MKEFDGKLAVVTGGGRGLGAAICNRLASGGAHVVVVDRDIGPANEVIDRLISDGLSAESLALDVSDAASVLSSINDVTRDAPVDILVNNAGISVAKPLLETSDEMFDAHFTVNLRGAFLMCRAIIPGMIKKGGGRIVNMSSALGRQGYALHAAYSASKFGVVGLTQSIAAEFGRHDITANCVVPGVVKTRMWTGEGGTVADTYQSPEAAEEFIRSMIPLGRSQEPEDVAEMVAFLVSDKARNITAGTFHVDGGLVPR